MLKVVADEAGREDLAADLDEIVRAGARRMLAAALEDEVAAYVAAHAGERDEDGRRLVVRNGHSGPRQVTTVAGAVEVAAPRVNDKRTDPATGERMRFSSAILPPWCRKSPKVTEVLPLLYLHGLSSKDFVPALEQFPGSGSGLSAPAITRLTEAWQEEYRRWCDRDLSGADYVYCWADGLHFGVRPGAGRVCTLVVAGVRADGKKELVALADGHRESTESWAGLLRDARGRGMRTPVLAVGDGALGFWAALREVFPETRHGRCWVHKVVNVLDCLPKSAQPAVRKALAQIRDAEDREHAENAVKDFAAAYGVKYPRPSRRSPRIRSSCWRSSISPPGTGSTSRRPTHRVHLRHRQAPDQGHQGPGQPRRRTGDGLQAHRGRQRTLALRQRPAPGRPRPGRCQVRERTAHRAAR